MTEYYSSEGAFAANGEIADYSDNYFNYTVDGQFDAYYVTRYADSIAGALASLTGNRIWIDGSLGADQVFVNALVVATENATATSYGNDWFVSLGDGDDASVIHTAVSGVGAGTVVSVSYDRATLIGGAGADILQTTQYVGSLDGAFVSVENTARFVKGGEGYDFINGELRIENGLTNFAGGTVNYTNNGLYVNAEADGADIRAQSFISALWSGTVNVVGNYSGLIGGNVIAGSYMEAGSADAGGGAIYYIGNGFDAMTAAEGGYVYAQNWLNASHDGFISFSDNIAIVIGQDGGDVINLGIGLSAGNLQEGIDGGSGEILNNETHTGGGAGDDHLTLFLNGRAEMGGSVIISGNYFYGEGGEGDDTLDLNWLTVANGGTVEFSGNSADLDGGVGSDTINAYLGEGVNGSLITLFGGAGDDFIQSADFGQNNERLISGGGGNDTIVDDSGFSTVVFDGALSDYTFIALSGGWISVTDNRDGSPDGTDQLHQVDQLRFSDGDVLVADLSLPIEGTEGDDTLLGTDGNDIIIGGSGHDVLRGFEGHDTLHGGDDDDFLVGGDGDDLLDGAAGWDRASFATGAVVGVTIDLNLQGTAQDTGQGIDTLNGIEHVSGTIFDDVIIGDDGDNWLWGGSQLSGVTGNDTLSGGGGNDLIEVGTGNHALDGGSGNDTLSFYGGGRDITSSGVTFSLALQGSAQDSEQGITTASGFENLVGSVHADNLIGDAAANILAGQVGDDVLSGGAGDDRLYGDGHSRADSSGIGATGPIAIFSDVTAIRGGVPGNDILEGGVGDDHIDGGGGTDTASYANAHGGVTIDLLSGRSSGADGNDSLINIENVLGSAYNDSLIGDAGANALYSGAGSDRLAGNGGSDHLTGGGGADRFIFTSLADSSSGAPDLITDFSGAIVLTTNSQGKIIRTPGEGDKIDLSFLDANVNLNGDQDFTLVQHGFSGAAGQAYSSYDAGTGITSLFLDVDGDAMADMTIQLLGQVNLNGADFFL